MNRRPERVDFAGLLALIILLATGAGCSKESGPPLVVGNGETGAAPAEMTIPAGTQGMVSRTSPPIELPVVSTELDNALLGFGRINDVEALANQIERAPWNVTEARSMLGPVLGSAQTPSARRVALFVLAGAQNLGTPPPMIVLVPDPAGEDGQDPWGLLAGAVEKVEVDGRVLAATTPAAAELLRVRQAELLAVADAAMSGQVQWHLNVENLMRDFAPMIQMMEAAAGMGIAAALQAERPDAPPEEIARLQRIVQIEIQALKDLLNQTLAITWDLSLTDNAIDFTTMLKARPNTTLAGIYSDEPVAHSNVMSLLESGSLATAHLAMTDMRRMSDIYLKYITQLIPAEQTDIQEQIRVTFDRWANMGAMDVGYAFTLTEDNAFALHGLIGCDDSDALMAAIREYILETKVEVMNAMMYGARYTEMAVEEAARSIDGRPVDRYTMSIELDSTVPPAQQELMRMMVNNGRFELEITAVDDNVVALSMNEPVDQVVDRYRKGASSSALAAESVYPPGGWAYLDFNVGQYLQMLQDVTGQTLPLAADDLEPLIMAAYHQQRVGLYRMQIPLDWFNRINETTESGAMTPPRAP